MKSNCCQAELWAQINNIRFRPSEKFTVAEAKKIGYFAQLICEQCNKLCDAVEDKSCDEKEDK
jgi:hypothetical protein